MKQALRHAVFVYDAERGWRFNACFPRSAQAVEEASWYTARNYIVAVLPVPDAPAKYTWLVGLAPLLGYGS